MAIRKLVLLFMVATSFSALTFGFRDTITPEETAEMRKYLADNKDLGLGICTFVVAPQKGSESSLNLLVAEAEANLKAKVQEIEATAAELDKGIEEEKAEKLKAEEEKAKNENTENVTTENVNTENANTENANTENVKTENLKVEEKEEEAVDQDEANKTEGTDKIIKPAEANLLEENEENGGGERRRRILAGEEKDVEFAFLCIIDSDMEPLKESGFGKFSEVLVTYLNKKNELIKSYGTSQTTDIKDVVTRFAILPYTLATGAQLIKAPETPNTMTFKYTSILTIATLLFAALF